MAAWTASVAAVLALTACGHDAAQPGQQRPPPEADDAAGLTWASFDPGMTVDALALLKGSGSAWRLVGVSNADASRQHAAGENAPFEPARLGSYLDPDLEALAGLQPRLVLWPAEAGADVPAEVRGVLGDRTRFFTAPMPRRWQEVLDRAEQLAAAFAVEDEDRFFDSKPVVTPDLTPFRIQAQAPAPAATQPAVSKPGVLLAMRLRPLRVWSDGSVLHELTAGAVDNLAAGFATPAPLLDDELLLELDPEVIVLVEAGSQPDAAADVDRPGGGAEVVRLAGRTWPLVRVADPQAFLVGLGTGEIASRVVTGVRQRLSTGGR